jgi:HTH-type transcriptional regulator / antitoxin MqsA
MKCPNCGAGEMHHDIRDVPYTYKGESTIIERVSGDFCPACNEIVLDRGDDNYGQQVDAFIRQVNASFVEPSYITKVRSKLHLDKKEASLLFGGGKNAFVRYESGRAKPPLSLVQLFKVLDKHPELLNEIKTA